MIHPRESLTTPRESGEVFDIVGLLENLGQHAGPDRRAAGRGAVINGEWRFHVKHCDASKTERPSPSRAPQGGGEPGGQISAAGWIASSFRNGSA
jgi:hypothetical protein